MSAIEVQLKIRPRSIAGVAAGFIAWWVAFYSSMGVFAYFWPEILDAGQVAISDNDWSLISTPMLILFTVMYFWINPIAGWLTVAITKNRRDAIITTIPLVLFAAFQHWYTLWNLLPNWYNLVVVILIPPLIFFGGRIAKIEEQTSVSRSE
ncbi:MAG: hypothetical protein DHS20C12_06160 [Pseudohongiella sp.]|nr:MAG: hypothetical protein DHS20C12_06160 [Pseudohongiella sp.]